MTSLPERNQVPTETVTRANQWAAAEALSLRVRLILLVIVSVLPLLLFVLGQQYQTYQQDRAAAGQQALDMARSITLIVERNIQTQIAVLEVLAGSIPLRLGDLDAFRQRVEQVVAAQLPGSNVLLFEKNGQQVMNLALPPGAALPVRQTMDSLNQLFATGRPVVSNMFFGIVMRRPVVSIEVPVRSSDGHILYSLAINPPLTSFAEIIRQRQLPEDWVASVFDGNGVIVARTPNPQQFIGQKASPSFLHHLMGAREGIVVSKSLEGVPVLSAFTHAADFNWSVGVGVPEASLVEPAVKSAIRTMAAGGALLLFGLLLAHLVARTISGPMESLRRAVGSGYTDAPQRPSLTGLRDVDEVLQAFHVAQERRWRSEEEQQRAVIALRQSEAKFRQLFASNPHPTWVFDRQTLRFLEVNQAAIDKYGYSREEFLGMTMTAVWLPQDAERLSASVRQRDSSIQPFRVSQHVVRDGRVIDVEIHSHDIEFEGSDWARLVVAHDTTNLRRAERQVQELTAELVHTSRLSAMGQLSSSLAHELNQPLTAVMNYSEAARQMMANAPGGMPPKVSDFLQKAAAQAERAGQIMRRLRSLVEKGPAERSHESLSRVVEEASSLAITGAQLAGIEVVFELSAGMPQIEIDKIQIQQVVVNLVRNAVEVLRLSPQRRLIVRTRPVHDRMQEVAVIDTGPGIAPEIAAQLFKPFVTTKKDGMGIGLSISQSIIETHGGRLWTEPNPGGGTIFRFTVPESAAEEEP